MLSFQYFTDKQCSQYVSARMGEEKLGQVIATVSDMDALKSSDCKYVIIGVAEDVGVRGNGGVAGAATAWDAFLRAFLNIQHNAFLDPQSLLILGHFEEEEKGIKEIDASTVEGAAWMESLDTSLGKMVQQIVAMDKIPILIGGGHNNAYGMLRGLSTAHQQAINVINLDPHADLRTTDYRHSGNGFSYARKDGFLHQYALLGLHEAYNNTHILQLLEDTKQHHAIFFEDIFMRNKIDWESAIAQSVAYVKEQAFGVELDMDAVTNTLSSAMTPMGVDPRMAYRYLYLAGQESQSAYLHIAEAVAARADGLKQATIGKLLSYLVQAFIKGKSE